MKQRDMADRTSRVIARGEVSGHSHIVTGDCDILENGTDVLIRTKGDCVIKHLIEDAFIQEEREVWTGEHTEIKLRRGQTYKYVQQQEYNPYEKAIRRVAD